MAVSQNQITASQVLYIKLGKNGEWEESCLAEGTIRLGYRTVPHDLCVSGNWEAVKQHNARAGKAKGTATSDANQIRSFYEATARTLWVTLARNSIWWVFSQPDIKLLEDGTKTRPVIGAWSCRDIHGKSLLMSQLSGKVLAMQGFRGTICSVKESAYLINKINGIQPKELQQAEEALQVLESRLETVIKNLTWGDFELLVDLIFRAGGWQRMSDVGATIKAIDLDLLSPITRERCGVQIKSSGDLALFKHYCEDMLSNMEGFTRFYFAVHSPSPDLVEAAGTNQGNNVQLLLTPDLARLAAQYGLTRWVIDKAR